PDTELVTSGPQAQLELPSAVREHLVRRCAQIAVSRDERLDQIALARRLSSPDGPQNLCRSVRAQPGRTSGGSFPWIRRVQDDRVQTPFDHPGINRVVTQRLRDLLGEAGERQANGLWFVEGAAGRLCHEAVDAVIQGRITAVGELVEGE